MPRPNRIGPLTPWFASRMTQQDRDIVAGMRYLGWTVTGYAAQKSGPFTAQAIRDDERMVGAGSSPSEALDRLARKVLA